MTDSTSNPASNDTPRALVAGVANKHSIAWGIAQALSNQGYELCLTYPDDRMKEKVGELAEDLPNAFTLPLNVGSEEDFVQLGHVLAERWSDGMNGLVHSIAFANREDLGGLFVDTSRDGFRVALEISAYSLIPLTRVTLPLLEKRNGGIVTLSYLGGQKVVPNYNVMGIAKAALEMTAKYLAFDLGPKKVRVNVISPGPVKTLAAKGITGFGKMMDHFLEKSPMKERVLIEEIGELAALLISDKTPHITGQVIFVDGGYEICG